MTNVLHCTACGIQGKVKCNCGEPYARITAHEAAVLMITTHPGWSDRKIAEAAGVAPNTIANARKSTAQNCAVEKSKRIGRDGKQRTMPKPKAKSPKAKPKDISPLDLGQQLLPQEQWEWDLLQRITAIANMEKEWTEKYGNWTQFHMTPCTYQAVRQAAAVLDKMVNSLATKEITHVIQNDKRSANLHS